MAELSLGEIADRDWSAKRVSGTVRFALVGAGWWTVERVIPAIAEAPHCEATVVVDQDRTALERAADLSNARPLDDDEYEAGVATEEYDAVYVATPNATHLPLVRAAANNGKDVLCEKPMEASVDRARRMVEICDRCDVTLMVAYRMQTEPLVRRARELLDDGCIGEPVQLHSDISARLLDINPDVDQWRLDPDVAGGCALIDLGVYPINTIRFLLETDPMSVVGTTSSIHPAFDGVDEHVWFQLRFPNSVGALCSASHNAAETSTLRIVGRKGMIEIDSLYHPWADRSLRIDTARTDVEISGPSVDQMEEEFEYFAQCLLTDREPAPDGRHGLRDMQVVAAVYESARTNEPVSVPDA